MSDEFRISRGGIPIPSIIEKPIKSLWKTYNYTLKDCISQGYLDGDKNKVATMRSQWVE